MPVYVSPFQHITSPEVADSKDNPQSPASAQASGGDEMSGPPEQTSHWTWAKNDQTKEVVIGPGKTKESSPLGGDVDTLQPQSKHGTVLHKKQVKPCTPKGPIVHQRKDTTMEPQQNWQNSLVQICSSYLAHHKEDAHIEQLLPNTAEGEGVAKPPTPADYEEYQALTAAIDNHSYTRSYDIHSDESIKYRMFHSLPNVPNALVQDSHCHAVLCAMDTLQVQGNVNLKQFPYRKRFKLVDRAMKLSQKRLDTLQKSSDRLAQLLILQAPNVPLTSTYKGWGRYDLKALGMEKHKKRLAKAHLTSDAAYGAQVRKVTDELPNNFAILDTGATKHFVTAEQAHRLFNKRQHKVTMCNANGVRTEVDEAGDYYVQLADTNGVPIESLEIRQANIVPGSTISLISATQLIDEGAHFSLSKIKPYMVKNGHRYALRRIDKLFVFDLDNPMLSETSDQLAQYAYEDLNISDKIFAERMPTDDDNDDDFLSRTPECALLAPAASAARWHNRLAHVHKNRIKVLQKSGSALGMNITNQGAHSGHCKCPSCMKTNKISRAVPKQRDFATTINQKGELISSDIVGPFPPSPEGHKYAISFVDEFTRFSHVYFMKQKSEAVDALKSLIADYHKSGTIIRKISTDQAGEYGGHKDKSSTSGEHLSLDKSGFYSHAFTKLCKHHDITHQLVPAYRHEINGVAERWNRTVMQMANTMLYHARISPVLWSSAVAHANFLRNRLPTSARGGFTPYELYHNRLPRYDNLRTWGCYAYKKLPKCNKTPGLPVRKRLIYVGDTANRIGFRCFDPIEFKFTTEYELIFDEDGVDQRSELLEAYDNRRRLAQQGKINEIPLVSQAQPNNHERTVYLPPDAPIRAAALEDSQDEVLRISRPEHNTSQSLKVPGSSNPEGNSLPCKSKKVHFVDQPKCDYSNPGEHVHNQGQGDPRTQADTTPSSISKQTTPSHGATLPPSDSSSRSTSSSHYGTDVDPLTVLPLPASNSPLDDESSDLGTEPPRRNPRRTCVKPTLAKSALTNSPRPASPTSDENRNSDFSHNNESNPGSNVPNVSCIINPALTVHTPFNPDETSRLLSDSEFAIEVDDYVQLNGPLSDRYIQKELVSFTYELHGPKPTCARRRLPLHQSEHVCPEMKKFLELAERHNFPLAVLHENPKKPRTDSFARYELSKGSVTTKEYFANLTSRGVSRHKARQDLEWDFCRGRIVFPQNLAPASANHLEFACVLSHELAPADTVTTNIEQADHTESPSFQNIVQSLWPADKELSIQDQLELDRQVLGYATAMSTGGLEEPATYRKATAETHPERLHWLASIKRELDTLESRETWEYVPRKSLGKHQKPIRCKFVFKKKMVKDSSIQYKSRLVACGYSQKPGLDYSSDELYASVCSYSSMRYLMSLATQKQLLLYQTDIQGAYLESHLTDELYMDIPPSLPTHNERGEALVCKIKRGLYGLKQSGFAWAQCFKDFMLTDKYNMGFSMMTGESNLYRKSFKLNGKVEEIIVGQYVDDCLLAASSTAVLDWYLTALSTRFPVNPKSSGYITPDDPGFLLSMHVHYDVSKGVLRFNQRRSIETLAKSLNLDDPHKQRKLPISNSQDLPKLTEPESQKLVTPYLSIVGSCLHIAQVSRPDISFAVGVLSRHSATPGDVHMKAARDLVSYLYSTRNLAIQYTRSSEDSGPKVFENADCPDDNISSRKKQSEPTVRTIEERLVPSIPAPHPNHPDTYVDADLGGDKITRKSTSGMVVIMNGGPIDWCSRLQKLCAQSSAEAEIYAAADCVKQALHIRLLCEESGLRAPDRPMTLWEDNEACIRIAHGLKGSNNAKHFQLRLRFLNEHVSLGNVQFSKIDTKDQLADAFTKALPGPAFLRFRSYFLVPHEPTPIINKE
jgi:hypothetical protein